MVHLICAAAPRCAGHPGFAVRNRPRDASERARSPVAAAPDSAFRTAWDARRDPLAAMGSLLCHATLPRQIVRTVAFQFTLGARSPRPPGLGSTRRCHLTTTTPSTSLVVADAAFSDAERRLLGRLPRSDSRRLRLGSAPVPRRTLSPQNRVRVLHPVTPRRRVRKRRLSGGCTGSSLAMCLLPRARPDSAICALRRRTERGHRTPTGSVPTFR